MAHENYKNELTEILRIITKHFAKSLDVISFIIRDIRMSSEHI